MSPRLTETAKAHLALLAANSFWGIGAVVGGIGLSSAHPLAFLTIRQALAGSVLLLGSIIFSPSSTEEDAAAKTTKSKQMRDSFSRYFKIHWKTFALCGLTIFGSNFGFLVGILLAGPVTASVWQPSQPILMAFICLIMGWEKLNRLRMTGVAVAFCGCITMVLLAPQEDSEQDEASAQSSTRSSTFFWIGNLLFFINCLSDPSYVLVSKRLLSVFSPLAVSAYSYLVSAFIMGISTIISIALASTFTSPESPPSVWTTGSIIPPVSALPAMIWFVFFSSAGAYALITWANQHATGTLVMSYTVLQPVSAVLLTVILLGMDLVPNCASQTSSDTSICLTPPNYGTFCGMAGVGLGLTMIIITEPKKSSKLNIAEAKNTAAGMTQQDAASEKFLLV